MATAENIAMARRVAELEQTISEQTLIWVRTTIIVVGRGPEREYSTWDEVMAAAGRPPEIQELRRFSDLELLIDPVNQTRRLRNRLSLRGQAEFDEMKQGADVRLVDIEIRCHEGQLKAILSNRPTVACFGGNRAGKTMVLIYWLLRRWMKRGGKGRHFWWVSPVMKKATQALYVIAGLMGLGGGVWPDELFVGLKPIALSAKNPMLRLVDGSILTFEHANSRDAGNLKSENITDAVVDEVGVIKSYDNFFQVGVRVSQSGGSVAAATTRVLGHWTHDVFTESDESIDVCSFNLFANPWLTYAAIWVVLKRDSLTVPQIEHSCLRAADKEEAARSLTTSAKGLREHFGIETISTLLMWNEWDDSLIYSSERERHQEIHIDRGGKMRKLVNITVPVMARHWTKQTKEGKRYHVWAALDPNVRGHAVLLELFGEGSTVEEATANRRTWTVLVTDEVQIDGTTQALGEALKAKVGAGACPIWYDPHGAPGHHARGSGFTSDDAILRGLGFAVAPAGGSDFSTNKNKQIPQQDSRNVMHTLMTDRKFLVHQRCVGTIDAMHNDKRKPDGRMLKRSSPDSESDFRSGFSDSVRYGVWPVFSTFLFKENDQ